MMWWAPLEKYASFLFLTFLPRKFKNLEILLLSELFTTPHFEKWKHVIIKHTLAEQRTAL